MVAFSARPTSTNELTQLVNLTAHGFNVGQTVIYNGAWVLAQADSAAHCAGTWIVSIVPSADTFYVTQEGFVNNLNSAYFDAAVITPGIQYYLSEVNAGNFTAVAPSGLGQIVIPCLVCITATTGFFYGGSGDVANASGVFTWTPITVNTAAVPNNGYIVKGSGLVVTLPATMAVGAIIAVAGYDAGGWTLQANTGQTIHYGLDDTTVAGSLASSQQYDNVQVICVTANTEWEVFPGQVGNLTVA